MNRDFLDGRRRPRKEHCRYRRHPPRRIRIAVLDLCAQRIRLEAGDVAVGQVNSPGCEARNQRQHSHANDDGTNARHTPRLWLQKDAQPDWILLRVTTPGLASLYTRSSQCLSQFPGSPFAHCSAIDKQKAPFPVRKGAFETRETALRYTTRALQFAGCRNRRIQHGLRLLHRSCRNRLQPEQRH